MIDILAGLKDLSRKRDGSKFGIEIKTDGPLLFNPDDKALSGRLAKAIRDQIAANLTQGKAPDGAPMPSVSSATAAWREREAKQGQRGGAPAPRYRDSTFIAKAQRNYQRDYTAARLGSFTPQAGGPRGVVSGMLAKSFLVKPRSSGQGFLVFVAAKRGKPRPGETKSALETVFAGIPLWSQAAMDQPMVRDSFKEAASRLLGTSTMAMLSQAAETLNQLQELASEADASGE